MNSQWDTDRYSDVATLPAETPNVVDMLTDMMLANDTEMTAEAARRAKDFLAVRQTQVGDVVEMFDDGRVTIIKR